MKKIKLLPSSEFVGRLDGIKLVNQDEYCLLLSNHYNLSIPRHTIQKDKIEVLMGKNVSIFRLADQHYIKKVEDDSD
jgi:hypothetical protein